MFKIVLSFYIENAFEKENNGRSETCSVAILALVLPIFTGNAVQRFQRKLYTITVLLCTLIGSCATWNFHSQFENKIKLGKRKTGRVVFERVGGGGNGDVTVNYDSYHN